jgi:hypothetical protein
VRRAKFRGDRKLFANGEPDIAETDLAKREGHEWKLAAVQFLEVGF